MNDFILSPAARRDLREIQSYIAPESIQGARRVITEIQQACVQLAENPQLGHLREDLTAQPVLFWTVRTYYIIYQPNTRPLEIVRIVHGARDVPSLL